MEEKGEMKFLCRNNMQLNAILYVLGLDKAHPVCAAADDINKNKTIPRPRFLFGFI